MNVGHSPPQYVSINNGVLLCYNCACGIHRPHYGIEVSFIKSISEDQWNHQQLRALINSGNKPLRKFMDFYDLAYESVQKRYSTVAMKYYRDKVTATTTTTPANLLIFYALAKVKD